MAAGGHGGAVYTAHHHYPDHGAQPHLGEQEEDDKPDQHPRLARDSRVSAGALHHKENPGNWHHDEQHN